MKKILAIVLSICMLVSAFLTLSACKKEPEIAVADGVFSRNCTFTMQLDYESELTDNPLLKLFIILMSDKEAKNALLEATSPRAFFDSKDIFFLTNGTYIIAETASENARKFNKVLDATASDEEIKAEKYTVGGYRITAGDNENEYIVAMSGSTAQVYTFSLESKALSGQGLFEEELYDTVKTKAIPEIKDDAVARYSEITAGGDLESKYLGMGDSEVLTETYREKNSETFFIHKVWYPAELLTDNSGKKFPLVVMANGSGTICTAYEHVFKHLASWGFIVVGNDEGMCYSGSASEASLCLMLSLNDDENSLFHNKIDTEKIGAAGHSQGGCGTVKATLNMEHGNMYKALYIASSVPTNDPTDPVWYYDASEITVPYLALAGTGNTDNTLVPLEAFQLTYDKISSAEKIIARRKNADHGEMLTYGNGYMVAWFMYHLQGDENAKAAFYGENAEITDNDNWQDASKNI